MVPTRDFLFCLVLITVGCLGSLAIALNAPEPMRLSLLLIVAFWIIVFVVVPLTHLMLKERGKSK